MSSQSEIKVKNSKSSDPVAKAERKARKAASAAATSAAAAQDSVEGVEGDMTAIAPAEEGEPGPGPSTKKRRRESEVKEENLLEINVEAPEPLSKAEARAAKKRAKLGLPEETASKDEKNKKKKKARVNADRLSDVEDEGEDGGEDSKGKGKAKDGKDKGKSKNKDKEGKPAKPAKKNSVWIGNLSFRTTEERIKEFLEKGVQEMGGPEGSVTRINLPKKEGKAGFSDSRGFAYVDFVTPEAQALAVGLSEKLLEGRKLLIKLGDDFKANPDARTPKPATIKAGGLPKNQPHSESSTLFVGNLPFDATEEAVRAMLEASAAALSQTDGGGAEDGAVEAGEEKADGEGAGETLGKRAGKKSGLRKVRLGQFEDTGRCKGFGFLDFLTPRHATSALSNRKNHFFQGRKLVLQYASAEATKRSGSEKKSLPPKSRGPKRPRTEHDGAEGSGEGTEGAGEGADFPAKSTGSSSAFGEHGEAPYRGKEQREQRKGDQRGKKWESAGRPRPGAALAMAKREKVGIVEAQGSKITFD